MAQGFDDFARKHEDEKANSGRLKNETKAEWAIVQGMASQFAIDGKGIGNRQFEWKQTLTGRPMLVLGDVAAVFEDDGDAFRAPGKTRVRFTRKPVGSGQARVDDSPLDEETWDLEPLIRRGEFVWQEMEAVYSAAQLADEIAKKLAQYHIDYKKAYDREA
jgi:hypothetical protein